MKKKIITTTICLLLLVSFLTTAVFINQASESNPRDNQPTFLQEFDFGDAPEGPTAVAYPALGVMGGFPTCMGCGPALWIQHMNFGAYFGQGVDLEPEGNGGMCPQCFPPYDQDEGFQDGDAGLIMPEPFTIDNTVTVVPFPGYTGTPLGLVGQTAVWGTDVDIWVHNTMPGHEPYLPAFVNVMIDWNQNGMWSDVPGEHVLINFVVPPLYIGPLSGLAPPNFIIGPNSGYVWARFSITEAPVQPEWPGEGMFEDGESEDYLLLVNQTSPPPVPNLACNGSLSWTKIKPGATVSGTFQIGNVGDVGSLLNWEIASWPDWGTWTFSPKNGTGLPKGSWVTITATCIAPDEKPNEKPNEFTGTIKVVNKDDPTDNCTIPVNLITSKSLSVQIQFFLERFFEQFPHGFVILRYLLGY